MKILFLFALLTNIIFFIWEYSSGALSPKQSSIGINNHLPQQILLLNELPKTKNQVIALTDQKPKKHKLEEKKIKSNNISSSKTKKIDKKSVPEIQTARIKKDLSTNSYNSQTTKANNIAVPKKYSSSSEKEFCYHIGPFENVTLLEEWRQLNKMTRASLNPFKKDILIKQYLVYSPPAKNNVASQQKVKILKKNIITDYWVYRKGSLKGGISLGLFARASGALQLKEKISLLGIETKIKQTSKTKPAIYTQLSTNNKVVKNTLILSSTQNFTQCKN